VILKHGPACAAKPFAVLLEALLDGIVTLAHLPPAKPRRVARASLPLLWGAILRLRIAASKSQRG
jgi:anti-sigma factor RsiW